MTSLVTATWKVLLDRNCYSLLLTTVSILSLVCSLIRTAKNKFTSTTLLSFEQLIYLGYFTLVFGGEVTSLWWRVGWWRAGFLVASWLVARWPDTMKARVILWHYDRFTWDWGLLQNGRCWAATSWECCINGCCPPQDSNHPDDLFQSRYVSPGFKPFSY